jgi:hypothetical protein
MGKYMKEDDHFDEKMLKTSGVNIDVFNLMRLIDDGNHERVLQIVNNDKDIVKKKYQEDDDDGDECLLAHAIRAGSFECAIIFIENGANVDLIINDLIETNTSMLHYALKWGQFKTLRLMLKNGAKKWSGDYTVDFMQYEHKKEFIDKGFLTEDGYRNLIESVASGTDPVRKKVDDDVEHLHVFGKGWVAVNDRKDLEIAITSNSTAELLSLPEIAAWQVVGSPAKQGSIVAALPALQRGAVWKVRQIEELWDSILRRFPIGSFVIAPPNDSLKNQDFKLKPDAGNLPNPTHLLLDGQQRATGIALGFYDIWQGNEAGQLAQSALWLDLMAPPQSREAEYIFRALTRSHPWGYKRTNPDETLPAHQIRAALSAFRSVHTASKDKRPEEFALWQTWPWDADAPVPVAILIQSVVSNPKDLAAARRSAWNRVQKLPMCSALLGKVDESSDRVTKDASEKLLNQRRHITEAFETDDSPQYRRLDSVLLRLQQVLDDDQPYQIPALPLDLDAQGQADITRADETSPDSQMDAAKKDAIELLFVRVNSSGTPLAGEELTYSLLKAAWPDAAKFIDGLDNKPALPSRIAMLCVRLILARRQPPAQVGKKLTMPPVQGVSEFRRLVRDQNPLQPEFFKDLTSFIENGANSLFTDAWDFLTGKPFALLPVLAVDLAQKSPSVYFLLLRWIDRLRGAGIDISQIDEATHRRTLGFLTALAWFAVDETKACSAIWQELQAEVDQKKLVNRFNRTRFAMTCRIDNRFSLRMIPLPTPEELELTCKRTITGHPGCTNTIYKADSAIWSKWDWYESFADKLVNKENHERWAQLLRPETELSDDSESPDISSITTQSAQHFIDKFYDSRAVLLFAQRDWLRKSYPLFDPSCPEFMEDKNRPWDYDHILPQSLLQSESGHSRRNIPQVIWDWCGSIGNLRAWPLEANRSDGDATPVNKLSSASQEENRYSIPDDVVARKASFIQEELDWPWWKVCVPMNDEDEVENRRYLALTDYRDNQKALITAIVLRFVALYREWYEQLRVSDLQ